MRRTIIIIISFLVVLLETYAQNIEFGTGCLPEPHPEQLPQQAELMSRDFENLPSSYSLVPYCPTPQTQGQFGTCTSWASAYAFRTILEAVKYNWTSKEKITSEAFSPIFIYAQIKDPNDSECHKGSHISDAMNRMKNVGAAKKRSFNVMCASRIPDDVMYSAAAYKIGNYTSLVTYGQFMMEGVKISRIKKAIYNKQPVVIAMHIYPSFNNCKDVWDGNLTGKSGYHAMCVVGYDDTRYGGAFLIQNSWGENWGNGGYVWVRYKDFCLTVDQAFTGVLDLTPSPINKNDLAGSIELKLSTGGTMLPVLTEDKSMYNIRGSYISGTRYRLYLTNNEPAFVYILGYDTNGNASLVFPPKDNISPALTYKNSHITIPDEKWYIEMDNSTGTDYLCVLYSKKELNIQQVIQSVRTGNGTVAERIKKALGSAMASPSEINYTNGSMSFKAHTSGTVVPIIASIKHI